MKIHLDKITNTPMEEEREERKSFETNKIKWIYHINYIIPYAYNYK